MPGAKARTLDVRDSLRRKNFAFACRFATSLIHFRELAARKQSSSGYPTLCIYIAIFHFPKAVLHLHHANCIPPSTTLPGKGSARIYVLRSLHSHGLTCHVLAVGSSKEAYDLADILRKSFSAAQKLMSGGSQLAQRFCLDPSE